MRSCAKDNFNVSNCKIAYFCRDLDYDIGLRVLLDCNQSTYVIVLFLFYLILNSSDLSLITKMHNKLKFSLK